jgi:hypothetical protein
MPATQELLGFSSVMADAEADALLAQLHALPEAEALRLYARLSPRLQWLARQRTTGQRRSALIVHHALTRANAR